VKKIVAFLLVLSMLVVALAACGATEEPTTVPAEPTAAPAEPTAAPEEPTAVPAAPEGSLEGKKVCYLIPESGNAFLSGLTEGVKEKFVADGVEVLIYGAEGDAQTQFNQIENCISQGVDGMIVMAALEPEGVASAVLEAKAAGIKVMGVPVDEQGPFDAIMHTDQYEIGTLMADMACEFIDATFPDAADDSVEVAIISTKGTEQLKRRTEGMETVDNCAKAKLVQFVDVPETTIAEAVSATENIFTANPDVKVVLVAGDSGAQGVAEAMLAYAPDNLDEYAVYSGDVSPDTQEALPTCEIAPYRGAVSIGGTLEGLIDSTYNIVKGMIGDGDFPAETLDPLTTFKCEPTEKTEEPAAGVASEVIVAIGADPADLSPFTGMSMGRIAVLKTIYEYLVETDKMGTDAVPMIAKTWEQTGDMTYLVTIFDNVYDSAGNHIMASDVAWSYNTAMAVGMMRPLGDIESVTATGDYTVEFVFKKALGPGSLDKLLSEAPIISQAHEATLDQFATNPVTTGPYVLTEYIPGSSLTFEKRDDYWQTDESQRTLFSQANVDKITFQVITEPAQHAIAMQTGTADISASVTGDDIALFDGVSGFTVFAFLDNLTQLLEFNGSEGNPFADNKELRQAVAYAIDTTAMCEAVAPGACAPAHTIGNGNFGGYLTQWDTEPYYEYDLAKAQELFAASGAEAGMTVELLAQNDTRTGLITQIIQSQLGELGITVNISLVEPTAFNELVLDPTSYDLVINAAAGGDFAFSPWQLVYDQNRNNGTTANFFKDDELQALLDTASSPSGFTPENLDAFNQYQKEQMYAYGLLSYMNLVVGVDGITEVVRDTRGQIIPGACEYAPDF